MENQEVNVPLERQAAKETAVQLIASFQQTFQRLADTKSEYKKMKDEDRSGFSFRRGSSDYSVVFKAENGETVYMRLDKISDLSAYGHGRQKRFVELTSAPDKDSNDNFFPSIRWGLIELGDSNDMHLRTLAQEADSQKAVTRVEDVLRELKSPR